jgi:hypothetical protein
MTDVLLKREVFAGVNSRSEGSERHEVVGL